MDNAQKLSKLFTTLIQENDAMTNCQFVGVNFLTMPGPAHKCQKNQLRKLLPARLNDSQEANVTINVTRRVYEEEKAHASMC